MNSLASIFDDRKNLDLKSRCLKCSFGNKSYVARNAFGNPNSIVGSDFGGEVVCVCQVCNLEFLWLLCDLVLQWRSAGYKYSFLYQIAS